MGMAKAARVARMLAVPGCGSQWWMLVAVGPGCGG